MHLVSVVLPFLFNGQMHSNVALKGTPYDNISYHLFITGILRFFSLTIFLILELFVKTDPHLIKILYTDVSHMHAQKKGC